MFTFLASFLVWVWAVAEVGSGVLIAQEHPPLPHSVDIRICFSYVAVPSSYSPIVGEWSLHSDGRHGGEEAPGPVSSAH